MREKLSTESSTSLSFSHFLSIALRWRLLQSLRYRFFLRIVSFIRVRSMRRC